MKQGDNMTTPLRRLIILAMSVTILFVQEQVLTFIPNVQFTTLLLVLYASLFKFRENVMIIFVHVILDSLYMGAFNPFYMTPMFIGWVLIPLAYHTVLNRTTNEVKLAIFALFMGFVYGWVFIPFVMIQLGMNQFWPYLLADIPFEIIMATANFITVLWLYQPMYRVLSAEIERIETTLHPVKKPH